MSFQALAEALKRKITGEVRFDDGSRALYATDASNYRQVPVGVVLPKNIEDLVNTVAVCHEFGAPILNRGAGTSLAGQCCNVAVVIDGSHHLRKILEIDVAGRRARVEPGVILDSLRDAVKIHGLTFGPDPATHNRCTLGGMIGNNACGVHSVMAGKTVDNVESLEILTYDGLRMKVGRTSDQELKEIITQGGRRAEIYSRLKVLAEKYASLIRDRFPNIPRRVSGYNLDQLLPENGFHVARALVGTEGTCVSILEAAVQLVPDPPCRVLAVLGYPDIFEAADDIPRILPFKPIGLEGMDENYIRRMKKQKLYQDEIGMLPEGESWLIVEFGAWTEKEAEDAARKMAEEIKRKNKKASAKVLTNVQEQKKVWAIRESTFGASVFVPGEKDTYAGFEDSAVPPAVLGDYLRDLDRLYKKYDYDALTYGHFGDGCIHTRISFELQTDAGILKYRAFIEEAADLVIRYGGSLSGEHGDGQNWAEMLPKMFGPELVEAFREFKSIWDPQNKMNPGKVVNAYRLDENLRLRTYEPISQGEIRFSFSEDGGDFTRTTQRCIGIGKCLKDEGAMCPSYMVTKEEKHSTRGRAHLLFEMMRGEVLKDGWKSREVKESLDLCLACKACKDECPVKVDMASYKAEFLSHYYEGKTRPLKAYLFGHVSGLAGFASKMPGLANFFTQTPGFSHAAKLIAGIASERKIPEFARETFKTWFRKRKRSLSGSGRRVLLWPDTFNNYFYPGTARSAVLALEALGFSVEIPAKDLCCGRPFYDFGMLKEAKGALRKILNVLREPIEAGIPVIGLEPSCLSVFRDELLQFFPEDKLARKLSEQTHTFAEWTSEFLPQEKVSPIHKKAILQGHCHQKSLMGMKSDLKLLSLLGIETEVLDSGCCGMAGAFGFDKEHYEVSMAIGERVLLPRSREAQDNVLLLADGFSCREQIRTAGRQANHLAEITARALGADVQARKE